MNFPTIDLNKIYVDLSNTNSIDIFSTLALKDFQLTFSEPSIIDCKRISEWIKQENDQRGKHMLERNPEKIQEYAMSYGCVCLYFDNALIGYVTLNKIQTPYGDIYEYGSLIKNPNAKSIKGIGQILVKSVLDKYNDRLIFSETNSPIVVQINRSLGQFQYHPDELPPIMKAAYEGGTPPVSDAIIFANKNL